MWVNIDLSLSIDEIISYLKSLDSSISIYFSFNTLCKGTDILKLIPNFISKLQEQGLNVQEGPHFVEEGCILNDEVKVFDELYFSTPGEKIIWYTKNFTLPLEITTITLLSSDLGIEPIIIARKDESKEYQYCFVQKEEVSSSIKEMLNDSNYKLIRIKE